MLTMRLTPMYIGFRAPSPRAIAEVLADPHRRGPRHSSAQRRGEQPRASEREPAACSTAKLGSDQHALPGARPPSVNDLIRASQERRRDRQPDRLRGSEIYDQLELRGLLDGQVGGFGALEELVHVDGRAPIQVKLVWAIDHETAGLRVLRRPPINRWEAPLRRELCNLPSLIPEYGVRENQERARAFPGHRREGTVDLLGIPRLQGLKSHPQGPSCSLRIAQPGCARWIGRIPEEGHPRDLGNHLLEQL